MVVPTFNESDNVGEIVRRLLATLDGIAFEIIFVDDNSPDGTADLVRRFALNDPRVRCLQRIGRRGLSSAVIEGMLSTAAPVVAVIDGDLQHDESLLPRMLAVLRDDAGVDLVAGSRYAEGGGFGDWSEGRRRMSAVATWIARKLTGVELSDPMSGFFMLRTAVLRRQARKLTGMGYKILLDILSAGGTPLSVRELPYEFRSRQAGESKLDNRVLLEFFEMIVARTVGRWVPTKFVMFSLVGGLGVFVHMAVLTLGYEIGTLPFAVAQALATVVAMTCNFALNNVFTYHDRRLRGIKLIWGWLSFAAASGVGAIANIGVAVYLFKEMDTIWFLSGLAGVVVGATWNFAVTSTYTWKKAS